MERFADYTLIEKIHDAMDSAVYRGTSEKSDVPVIIKMLKTRYPTVSDIARFKQEYNLVRQLNIDGVVKIYELLEYAGQFGIVQEDFNGVSLKRYLKTKKLSLSSFLTLATDISRILGRIHQHNIIHLDIKPDNILVNESTGELKITDFGISTLLTHINEEVYRPEVVEGTLPYMSPEQTGRMNRNVDYRTDLYSLGVTFYEMLTGNVPFKSDDPMEMIHSHIARKPTPPVSLDPSIPQVVSHMVMKLLAKMPEERYQNSLGLMADLAQCSDRLSQTGTIDTFELAGRDVSIRFNLPQLIIGREKELGIIMDTFRQVSDGARGMTLVLGNPGIGKSALVSEIHKPIVGKRGYFIFGKYDPFKREAPYSAIIQAFQWLAKQILTESEARVAAWKEKLVEALGANGRVVTSVIPELEHILGPQPQITELPPEESKNRFNMVFHRFINAVSTRDHPLVMFLDDLQWADSASLMLLKNVMTHPETRFLLLIGAYRDNEVTPHHPLSITINEMKKGGLTAEGSRRTPETDFHWGGAIPNSYPSLIVDTISLGPLSVDDVNHIIMTVLRCDAEKSLALSEMVQRKTGGNPFFVNQFLKNLYDNKYIELTTEGEWIWSLGRIREMEVTDNVVSFMAEKISRLPTHTKNILKICACIGNRFDLETLSMVSGQPVEDTLEDLMGVISEDMVGQFGDLYKFLHDRIHEAAYSLIGNEERVKMHHKIGSHLLKDTPVAHLDEKVFYIVDQLNRGSSLIESLDEKIELVALNLHAGEKALHSTAYDSALAYLKEGAALLPFDRWTHHYGLTFKLFMGQMTCEYLTQNFDRAVSIFNDIIAHSTNSVHKAEAYTLMIILYTNQGDYEEALRVGLEGCRLIGFITPRKVSNLRIAFELVRLYFKMGQRKIEDFAELPIADDEGFLAYHNMQIQTGTVGYYIDPNLFCFVVIYGLSKIFEYGNSYISPLAYCALGSIIGPGMGLYDAAYRFGQTALKVDKKLAGTGSSCRTHFTYTMFIQHWKKHAKYDVPLYRDSYKKGIELGDLIYSCHSINMLAVTRIIIGDNIDDVLDEYGKYRNFLLGNKDPFMARRFMENIQFVRCLKGRTGERGTLDSDEFEEGDQIAFYYKEKNYIGLYCYELTLLRVYYLFGKIEECLTLVEELHRLTKNKIGTGSLYVPEVNFYSSLALCALCIKGGGETKRRYLKRIRFNQKKMRTWQKHCPENFLHKYLTIEGELARIKKDNDEAVALYRDAIRAARETGYVQNEGIANERAATLAQEMGRTDEAVTLIREARFCFAKYGADEKVKALEENYGELFQESSHAEAPETMTPTAKARETVTGSGTQTLDLASVIKISQSLSSEVDLRTLLEKMINLSIENAGAQMGFLILENELDNKLYIEAAGKVDEDPVVLKSIPLDGCDSLAISIVNYVNKTNESIVIDDASDDVRFLTDHYIMNHRPKSLLCAPIVFKGKTAGIVYLENNLITNAFTPDRLELLSIFSAQAAISIENSRLMAAREQAAKLATEMDIAANIQSALVPDAPGLPGFEITAYLKPADAVGGDYYDVISASGYHWVIIGDVSGHGVPAGLIMMMVETCIQAFVRAFPDLLPSQLLRMVNEAIKYNIDKMKEQKYMTINAFRFDESGRALFSGMHQDIFIYRASEDCIDTLSSQGIWLSPWDMDMGVPDGELVMKKDDVMLLYTDGITEAKDAFGHMFSEERLLEVLSCHAAGTTETIKDNILNALEPFTIDDDIAMVILKKQ